MMYLLPLGPVDQQMLRFLKQSLSSIWPTELLSQVAIPEKAYDKIRKQFDGSQLLQAFPDAEHVVLGVIEGER
jgi:predicted Zn-dependent protease